MAEYPATSDQNGYRHREEKNNGIIWPNIRPRLIRPDTGTGKKKITELYGRISGASHQQKTDLQKTELIVILNCAVTRPQKAKK